VVPDRLDTLQEAGAELGAVGEGFEFGVDALVLSVPANREPGLVEIDALVIRDAHDQATYTRLFQLAELEWDRRDVRA